MQVRAYRIEPVVPGEPVVTGKGFEQVSPASGPWTIAIATARFSVTIGFGAIRSSSS